VRIASGAVIFTLLLRRRVAFLHRTATCRPLFKPSVSLLSTYKTIELCFELLSHFWDFDLSFPRTSSRAVFKCSILFIILRIFLSFWGLLLWGFRDFGDVCPKTCLASSENHTEAYVRQVSEPELWSYCLASCSLQTASCLNAHIVMLTVEHKLGHDAWIIPVLIKKGDRFRWRSRQDIRKEQVCFLLKWNCSSGMMQNASRASPIMTAIATCIQMR